MQQMMTAQEYLETAPAADDDYEAAYNAMLAHRSPEQAQMDHIDQQCYASQVFEACSEGEKL